MAKRKRKAAVVARASAAPAQRWAEQRQWRVVVLALPSLALLVALLLAEGIVRLAQPHVDSLEAFVRLPLMQNDLASRNQARIFEGDPLLFWRLKSRLKGAVWDFTAVSTNDAGLRSDQALEAKAAQAVRILCLGDSVTFGYRVPVAFPAAPERYDRNDVPYPALVERWLRRANAGRAIEVLNMAVPGYSSRQALAWLRRDIRHVQPDLVTICVGWNDVSAREQPDRDAMPMDFGHVLARRVVGSSQLLMRASLAAGRLGRRLAKDGAAATLVPRATASEFAGNVIAAAQVARAHGSQVVVIGPVFGGLRIPSPEMNRMTTYRATLRRAAEGEGLAFLEVADLTEAAFPNNAAYFPIEAIHPGPKGHRLLAQMLLRLLEERGMLASLGLEAPQAEMRESP